MLVLCDDQVAFMNMQREIAAMGGLRGSLAAQKSVKDEAEAFLKQKSCAQLLQLKATIESKLRDSGAHDTEFMEEVRSSCLAPVSLPQPRRRRSTPASSSSPRAREYVKFTRISLQARSTCPLLHPTIKQTHLAAATGMKPTALQLLVAATRRTRLPPSSSSRRDWRKALGRTRKCVHFRRVLALCFSRCLRCALWCNTPRRLKKSCSRAARST
jgi:hypothetical protein